jgi:hypothetical protein
MHCACGQSQGQDGNVVVHGFSQPPQPESDCLARLAALTSLESYFLPAWYFLIVALHYARSAFFGKFFYRSNTMVLW